MNNVDTIEPSITQFSAGKASIDVDAAYGYCQQMASQHYENFPVASRLIPKELRRHVAAIYAFARIADDYADEGSWTVAERLDALNRWEGLLREAAAGNGTGPVFTALGETIRTQSLPVSLLEDLLKAFRMDASGEGYETLDDLLRYCTFSANPVGRLVLHLFGYADPERVLLADNICTGLQLVNFCQDVSVDIPRERINIPRSMMGEFGYSQEELLRSVDNQNFRALLSFLNSLAEDLLRKGAALPSMIPSLRFRLELKTTVLGGLQIAKKIRDIEYDVLHKRPTLGKLDVLRTIWGVVFR